MKVITCYLLAGLNKLHSVDIMYKDLKASHVFVSKDMQIRLIDFGMAEKLDWMTRTSTIPGGTCHAMSPEMLELFYKKSTEKAAFYTLVLGCVLGFIAFCLLSLPVLEGVKNSLPAFYQNKLNLSPVITALCALTMYLVSNYGGRTEQDYTNSLLVKDRGKELTMSDEESKKYRRFMTVLVTFMLIVVASFSPLFF